MINQSSFETWNMFGTRAFVDRLLQILRIQLFPPDGAMVISPKTTVGLVINVLKYSAPPCVALLD